MIEKSLFSFFNILRENRQFIFNVIFPEEASWAALNPSVENEPLVGHLCYSGLDFNSLIIVFFCQNHVYITSCMSVVLYWERSYSHRASQLVVSLSVGSLPNVELNDDSSRSGLCT